MLEAILELITLSISRMHKICLKEIIFSLSSMPSFFLLGDQSLFEGVSVPDVQAASHL